MNMIASSSPSIKTTLVQSLFDIFMVHENAMFKNQDNNVSNPNIVFQLTNILLVSWMR